MNSTLETPAASRKRRLSPTETLRAEMQKLHDEFDEMRRLVAERIFRLTVRIAHLEKAEVPSVR